MTTRSERTREIALLSATAAIALALTGCAPGAGAQPGSAAGDTSSAGANPWFDQAQYEREDAARTAAFVGDAETPYLQHLEGEMTEAGAFTLNRPGKVCFSNAALSNTWRQTGWLTMNQQLATLQEQGAIGRLETRNAQDSDDTQVADIDYFISEGDCDGFIIAPNSPKATAAAVQRACDTGKPVVIFDRAAGTDCETSFVHSIGGMAWGIDSAGFIADRVDKGARVIALRTAPGVDVFEERWAAAQHVFAEAGIAVTDQITGADPTKIKSTITNAIAKGDVDAVWVDLGDQAVPAIEAFEDAGVDVPIVTGEDNLAYLRAWKESGIDGFAPVYSAFQWRTALVAMAKLLQGESIPSDWVLPQVPVTADDLDDVLATNEGMPDGHYASFGGEDLPGFPEVWQKREMP